MLALGVIFNFLDHRLNELVLIILLQHVAEGEDLILLVTGCKAPMVNVVDAVVKTACDVVADG